MNETKGFKISGFSEAVFVVCDIEKSKQFYCDVVGWQEIVKEHDELSLQQFWQVAPDTKIRTCVVGSENVSSAHIRLVEFSGIKQKYIRANSQIWDVGGIFDINIRVKSVHQLAELLHKHQWFGVNNPVEMVFGPFKVYEWLAKSHDGITHALIERIEPPLETETQAALFGQLINASMIVKDHQLEMSFIKDILGFETLIHQEDTFDKEASNVFGMPFELVAKTPHVLTLLSADGGREGTVELASFPELTGNDFSSNATPYNLGITCLRFPLKGMANFVDHLKNNEVPCIEGGIVEQAPYGQVNLVAVNSPSGNRFEFFEVL